MLVVPVGPHALTCTERTETCRDQAARYPAEPTPSAPLPPPADQTTTVPLRLPTPRQADPAVVSTLGRQLPRSPRVVSFTRPSP